MARWCGALLLLDDVLSIVRGLTRMPGREMRERVNKNVSENPTPRAL